MTKNNKNKRKETYTHKYLKWNDYHRAYQMYKRNNFPYLDYFLEWNTWKVDIKDTEESKVFNCNDKYYILKMNKLINN